jgi:hypothetical protein
VLFCPLTATAGSTDYARVLVLHEDPDGAVAVADVAATIKRNHFAGEGIVQEVVRGNSSAQVASGGAAGVLALDVSNEEFDFNGEIYYLQVHLARTSAAAASPRFFGYRFVH